MLNNIAAQSGIRVWTTKGRDSNAIALYTSKVTKNKWWSLITARIVLAIFYYSGFLLIDITSSCKESILQSPTVKPEQKAPTQIRTTLIKHLPTDKTVLYQNYG